MTVPAPGSLTYSYSEDGVTTIFAYPVRFIEAQELVVIRTVDGIATTLTMGVDYTVSGEGNPAGGSITRTAATNGGTITIYRDTTWKQLVDLEDKQRNPAQAVEDQLDRLTMAGQDARAKIETLQDKTSDLDDAVARAEAAKVDAEAAKESAEDSAAAAEAAAASASGVTPVADRAALKALDTANKKTAISYAEGGRNGTFVFSPADLSAEVAADDLEGIYIAPDSDDTGASGAWVRQYVGLADVRWWGAALDNVTDDTAAFNAALLIAKDVSFPEGLAYITDMIDVPNHGNLIGLGVVRSRFSVRADFNLGALGVIRMGTSENVGLLDKIGIEFEQPASGARADMIQYPWAVYHNDTPRVRIGHIRITRGWLGINAGGNAGGAKYDIVECGTLSKGLLIDGSLDTIDIGYFKVWPYGIGSSGDGGTGDVFRDQANVGAEIGRCDGLEGSLILFQAGLLLNANATAGGGNPRHLRELHLDSDGAWFEARSGQIDIDYCYITRTSNATKNGILLQTNNNPKVRIGSLHASTSEVLGLILVKDTGSLDINGGRIHATGTAHRIAYLQGGALKIRNTELSVPGTRTQPVIRADAGDLIVQNCDVAPGSGTGELISVTSASVGGKISNNKLAGLTLGIAATALIGQVEQSMRGSFSADGSTTVRLPAGWSMSKPGTGNYNIVHNLGWTLSRTHVTITPQGEGDVTAQWDIANSSTISIRLRTKEAGVAADVGATFEVSMT